MEIFSANFFTATFVIFHLNSLCSVYLFFIYSMNFFLVVKDMLIMSFEVAISAQSRFGAKRKFKSGEIF